MPVFDKPLADLRKYKGINPCPSDIDQFWDAGLKEMRAVDPNVELKPSSFQTAFADCFHLFFTGVGGSRIHAKFVRPKRNPKPHPAILNFHGYSGNSGDWVSHLPWAAQGYSVAAMDCRGQ